MPAPSHRQSTPVTVAAVGAALGRVLAIDPANLRRDTPLRDIGCDEVAVLSVYLDVLAQVRVTHDPGALDLVMSDATLGDIVDRLAGAMQESGV